MAKYFEAPDYGGFFENEQSVFLAGGITNVIDWQKVVADKLAHLPYLTIYNPRRADFDLLDEDAAREQIKWEYNHLQRASSICFWFSNETVQPIALFELGKWSALRKQLFVGCHPEYVRRYDVKIQMALAGYDTEIHNDLDVLIGEIGHYFGGWNWQEKY